MDIARARLQNQRLTSAKLKAPADVVRWFGAVQAQDYYGATWALGARTKTATAESIEQAFAEGEILRTHVMRPTWHFVAPQDIRWMLDLTAPRINAAIRGGYRSLELDTRVLRHARGVIERALQGGKHLTRSALREALARAGVNTDGQRFAYILIHAELEAGICSGPRLGKQFTYALLEERTPRASRVPREEALAMLTKRYFTSHGPARLRDFTWWSGLTAADAQAGLASVRGHVVEESIDGVSHWRPSVVPVVSAKPCRAFLLPAFDEYLVAYKDRGATLAPAIVVDGRVVGTWKRTTSPDSKTVMLRFFEPVRKREHQAVLEAVDRYSAFLGRPVAVTRSG